MWVEATVTCVELAIVCIYVGGSNCKLYMWVEATVNCIELAIVCIYVGGSNCKLYRASYSVYICGWK